MDKDYLVLKRASTSRSSGEWSDDDYDVLADGDVVGRIFKVHAAPVGMPWLWTLARHCFWGIIVVPVGPMPVVWMMTSPSFAQT
jgi:hypothetical protein